MGIKNLSESVLLIDLPEQPQTSNELEDVTEIVSEGVNHHVVVDFSEVQMLTSETLCGLMILDRLLRGVGRLLVLCNVSTAIEHILVRTGLAAVFEFAKDESAALQRLDSDVQLRA